MLDNIDKSRTGCVGIWQQGNMYIDRETGKYQMSLDNQQVVDPIAMFGPSLW